MHRISTNAAYLKNEIKYPVVFEYAGQDTAVVSITANEGEAIENDGAISYGQQTGWAVSWRSASPRENTPLVSAHI